jgi:hypothetical protein
VSVIARICVCAWLLLHSYAVSALELSGYVGVESLGFLHSPLFPQQHNHYLSAVIQPQLVHEWDNGKQSLAFVPFFRLSQYDSRRTHFDIRELTWLKAADTWELRTGIRKVFWGVTESQHLVDIINQTDFVENFDTEDKLGQPMINLALIRDWGTIDLFVLPGFRERTFAGPEGRLNFPLLNQGAARFEKHGIEKHLAYALRWSKTIGEWDIGLSNFYGTNRTPTIVTELGASGKLSQLIPYYQTINQTGLDVQYTKGNWLWKLEAIVRAGQGKTFVAGTGGLEYSFYNVFDSGLDIGLVAEYLYDSRGRNGQTFFQDDIMAGLRFGFNDEQSTEMLAGVIFDRTSNAKFYSLEASRRLGESFKLELQARFFSGADQHDFAYFLRQDDHIRAELSYHF